MTGVPGTLAAGFAFNYLHRREPDSHVEEIEPDPDAGGRLRGLPGTTIFSSQEGRSRVVCHAGLNGHYRTICSSVIFSALRGTDEELGRLCEAYVRFLAPDTPQ